MKNKYSSYSGIIYIDTHYTTDGDCEDSVIPVFASRESLLKALAECEHEYDGGNFLDNYRDAVRNGAEFILKEYGNINTDNLIEELSSDDINIEQVLDDVIGILFNYQDYLAVSLQDKELLEDIAEDLISNDKPEESDGRFEYNEDCKDEFYWFINSSEVHLSNLCVIKNLTEDEIKLYKEASDNYENANNKEALHTIYKLKAASAIRLAHKVKDNNF